MTQDRAARWIAAGFALLILIGGLADQAAAKTLKFWNLTALPITALSLAPAGTVAWSPNFCLSDPDHAVDPDERLNLAGIGGGVYDVRVTDSHNRTCVFHAVTVKAAGPYAFSISEQQMKTCSPK
jgi:hypothetical protein